MSLRHLARSLVPFPLRVELVRLRRLPVWRAEHRSMALAKSGLLNPHVLTEYCSPLRRSHVANEKLQAGKEHNVALGAGKLDGIRIEPGQTFSYHHAVGRPSRLRGFRMGLELHGTQSGKGVGGGCCQISNLLYLLAITAGLEIVERHRHALDLFPDHGRTVPFGCGATVFYNTSDLRFRNPYEFPIVLSLTIGDGKLIGRVLSDQPLPWKVEIYEKDHQFRREGDSWWRENRIRRRFLDSGGQVVRDEEIAHNCGRCLYDPENPGD